MAGSNIAAGAAYEGLVEAKGVGVSNPLALDGIFGAVDDRTRELVRSRRAGGGSMRRGWVVRRALLAADTFGLAAAYLLASLATAAAAASVEGLVFILSLPLWIVLAKLQGLYDRDEDRADHSTADDVFGVFQLITIGSWIFFVAAWTAGVAQPGVAKLILFWLLAIILVNAGRAFARWRCRTSLAYLQNTLIVGAGDVGQLVARKILQHPEYGINLVGFVDDRPREARADIGHLALLGGTESLPDVVRLLDVERVVVAFSNESDERTMAVIRELRAMSVQVDVVPRLFDLVGPRAEVHTLEGLPLVGLPPARIGRSSMLIKRAIDVAGALLGLLLTAPVFAYAAWRIKRESPGPVFFRQTRLGLNSCEFTALKFRTMYVDTDDTVHREYIRQTMSSRAAAGENGLYKLDRDSAVTPFGRWLRRTSLDELPQLINVLRGDMSLVGPRPCIPYETEHFAPHQFERFLVPAGITGLWQVTARARSSFGEALDMDVSYARGWSLGLDVRLLFRTPFALLRHRTGGTA